MELGDEIRAGLNAFALDDLLDPLSCATQLNVSLGTQESVIVIK